LSNYIRSKTEIPSIFNSDFLSKMIKCLDAIEGNAKAILTRVFAIYVEDRLDDSEYIRNVKAVIEATRDFVEKNPEITDTPKILDKVLYSFSKEIWLENLKKASEKEMSSDSEEVVAENEGYHEYYFDYIYHHGIYPR
jgi:hypothetical protein